MELLTLVLSIAFIQVWGAQNPLHNDRWFHTFVGYFAKYSAVAKRGGLMLLVVAVPALIFCLLQLLLGRISVWLMLPLSIVVLLYSFGRGDFKEVVSEYTKACYVDDWTVALQRAKSLDVDVEGIAENDWNTLHQHVLDQAGYRGFEGSFAVLFWFFILGPAGALFYRSLAIYHHQVQPQQATASRLLWLLEWPAVRLLGISFAFTGNFVGCYERWRECLLCSKRSTVTILGPLILGALAVRDNTAQTGDVTRKELALLDRLYLRTLRFWLAAAALIILIF